MLLFVDTSAILAVMNADDEFHSSAREAWADALARNTPLVVTNYILVETVALLQARVGIEAVALLESDILPVFDIRWVDEVSHRTAMAMLLAAGRRRLSLVDCASFECMRRSGLRTAFTFDPHFREQGFEIVPSV
jgi:predicted nucleic acid-binding protein